MSVKGFKSHPYIPNSVPEVEQEMLKAIGLQSIEELHEEVPQEIVLKENMNIPEAFGSEYELRRHVEGLLKKNKSCADALNFLGAGCYQHYVPALCDEIASKGEFLTAYGGESYNDFGRFQALFEFESLVAEMVDMEVVNVPTMDYAQAASTAIRMACRVADKRVALLPESMDPEKQAIIRNYCEPDLDFVIVKADPATGRMDLADLKARLNAEVGAVYFENPMYLGMFEVNAREIAEMAHAAGAQVVVGCDPISLGVVASPRSFGADIICGDVQSLGIHMNFGGGQSGFMATMDDPKYVLEFPSRLFGICQTSKEGEYAFARLSVHHGSERHAGSGRDHHEKRPVRGEEAGADPRRVPAFRGSVLRRIRARLLQERQDRGRDQQGAAREEHLRRQGPVQGVRLDRRMRHVLRHRDPHEGRHRQTRG